MATRAVDEKTRERKKLEEFHGSAIIDDATKLAIPESVTESSQLVEFIRESGGLHQCKHLCHDD